MYRFLFRPKWLLFLASCAALAALFVSLGFWQLDRLDQRRAMNDRVISARHSDPVNPGELLSTDRTLARRDEFRQVRTVGQYDADHEYLVRGHTVQDRPGAFVLTPLVTEDGTALLVVRGWVPLSPRGADVAPDVPAAPNGTVTVVGRVRPPEQGRAQETQVGAFAAIRRIAVSQLAGEVGHPTYLGYIELVEQTPRVDERLVSVPEPELTEGPHLSYAVQWFAFAVLAFVGYGIYARREEQRRREPAEAPVSPAVVGADSAPE